MKTTSTAGERQQSALAIARQVQYGQLSAAGPACAALARLADLAPLNAMTHVVAEAEVMAQAAWVEAELARGSALPLAGVPFVVKDNIATAAMPTSGGSWQLRGRVAQANASAVERMLAAGAIPVGKANLHELAFGATSANAGFGPVLNPHDPTRVAGGSSGGSAVAVAQAVPLALGTDTGGSIRIPAAFCGVYGFRPSRDRYPGDGIMTISRTRDALGSMANSLEDLLLLDAVLSGSPGVAPAPPGVRGLRIGVPRRPYFDGLDDSIAAAAEQALDVLGRAGAILFEVDASELARHDEAAGFVIAANEARQAWGAFCQEQLGMSLGAFSAGIASADVRHIFAAMADAPLFSEAQYQAALVLSRQMASWYGQRFERDRLDCLLLPTTLCEAPLLADSGHDHPDAGAQFARLIRQAGPATLGGIPSIAFPLGRSARTGLPLGLMCDGPAGGDRRLLSVALAIDKLLLSNREH